MIFRSPEALIVLALLVPVALLYVVHARRPEMRDPFQFLWVGLARERPRWGRLHRWLELALVMIALLAMILGLARPATSTTETAPRVRIVAVAEPTDDAMQRARALVSALAPGEVGTIVASGVDGVDVVLPPTHAPVAWSGPLRAHPDATRRRGALADAVCRLADDHPGAEVHWLDVDPGRLDLPRGWRAHAVVSRGPMLAIDDVNRDAEGRITARLVNRGATSWRGVFRATLADARLDERIVDLNAGASDEVVVSAAPDAVGVVRLALLPVGTPAEVASAAMPLPGVRGARVAVVARGGAAPFVGRLLASFGAEIDGRATVLVSPDAAARVKRDAFDFALVLESAGGDAAGEIAVPAIYFGTPHPLAAAPLPAAALDAVRITEAARDHPLLARVDLTVVGARQTPQLIPAPGVSVLARSKDRPMLLYRPPGERPEALAFSFRLRESNLLFEPALVVLVANAIARWGPAVPRRSVLGDRVELPAGSAARVARVGDDEPVWFGRDADGHPFRSRRTGRFRAAVPGGEIDAWVNDRPVRVDAASAWTRPSAPPAATARDVWRERLALLAWIALALLLVEWVLFHRGII